MSKFNDEIFAKVTLEEEGTGIEEEIFIPISPKDYFEVSDKLQGKNMKVKEIYTNCDISTKSLQKKYVEGLEFCYQLQRQIQDLNMLSNEAEVQALIEYHTADIEKLVEFIQLGKFHFYPDLTFEDIENGCTWIGPDLELYIDNMNDYGYFEASTGIIYIPEKSTK